LFSSQTHFFSPPGHSDPRLQPQGQYWAGRAPPPYKAPLYMAAANFVVITNGEGCVLNGTAAINQ